MLSKQPQPDTCMHEFSCSNPQGIEYSHKERMGKGRKRTGMMEGKTVLLFGCIQHHTQNKS